MADWYVSSAAYATYTVFQTSHLYSIGDIIVPTAPTARAKWVFRCTTGGTSTTEPSWTSVNNATSTSGTAIFTNITGQSAFFWTAAAGDIPTMTGQIGPNRFQAGDRMFVSSDHSETQTLSSAYGSGSGGTVAFNVGQILSVNRAGSTPPVAADLTAGATVIYNVAATMLFESSFPTYHYGITYSYISTFVNTIFFNSGTLRSYYLDTCTLWLNSATANLKISSSNPSHVILNNTILKFGAATHQVAALSYTVQWEQNGGSIAGTAPNSLFVANVAGPVFLTTCRGADMSAVTGCLFTNSSITTGSGSKFLFESCKIASSVTRLGQTVEYSTSAEDRTIVELINCYDGTNIISEVWQVQGNVTTEFTQYLVGGAQDDVGNFSHRMIANTAIDKYVMPLNSFWMDVEYSGTLNVSKTATVEILSTSNFNNDEISLFLEYEGTAGSSQTSFGSSLPATVLTAATAVSASGSSWNSPAIPWGAGGYASSTVTALSGSNFGAASIFLTKVILTNSQTVTAILLNMQSTVLMNFRALIYDSTPSSLLGQGNAIYGGVVTGINRFVLTSPLSLSAGTYYVGYVADTAFNAYVDSNQTGSSWGVSGQSVSTPANPLVGGATSANALHVALEFSNAAQTFGWGPDYTANVALSSLNQLATFSSSGATGVRSVTIQSAQMGGKYYCEVLVGGTVDANCYIGLTSATAILTTSAAGTLCHTTLYRESGSFVSSTGVTSSGSPSSWAAGDVIGIAFDANKSIAWFNKNNGTWFGVTGSNDPASGVGGVTFNTPTLNLEPLMVAALRLSGSTAATYTIQDRSSTQTYSPPSGFVAWSGSTPVAQHLQVTFTPQHKGRVRGQIRLGRAGIVYYNPSITIA